MAQIVKADLEGLARAAKIVAEGGVICYPTDTLYGLGCDPQNPSAVARTMKAKGDRTKPMPVLVKDLAIAEKLAYLTNRGRILAREFWPGALTLVVKARAILPQNLTLEGKVGVRSPKHAICLNLLELCGGALVGTSANLTGMAPATSPDEASQQIGTEVDLILDGGKAALGVGSTVVDLTQPKLSVLREGPVDRECLLRSLRRRR